MHLVGSGDSQRDIESPVWVNPQMDSYWHPILKIQKHFYMNGSCADTIGNNGSNIDKSVVQKKLELVREMPAGFKLMLFAFDWFHDESGQRIPKKSIFNIPDAYANQVAQSEPQAFDWVCRIHPYRADALRALESAANNGARAVK